MIIWRVLGGKAGFFQKRLPAVAAGSPFKRVNHVANRRIRFKLSPHIPRGAERFPSLRLYVPFGGLPLNQPL
jgi:hypothetical protein